MPFKSDEQRKAAFANMNRRGGRPGGHGPRPPSTTAPTGGDSLFDILNIGSGSSPFDSQFNPLPNSQGQATTQAGSAVLTGGAIYATINSDWAIHQPAAPDFGSYNGPGIGPYDQQFSLTPQEAAYLYQQNTGIGTMLYNMLTQGVDPYGQGGTLLPYGTPGTLKPFYEMSVGAYETWRPKHDDKFGHVANPPSTGINPAFLNQKKPKKKKKGPTWIFGGGT